MKAVGLLAGVAVTLAAMPAGGAMAAAVQAAPAPVPAKPVAKPVKRDPLAPTGAPTVQAQPAEALPPPPPPPPPPPAVWTVGDVQALLGTIVSIGREGLDPADYDPAGLQAALASGNPIAMSAAATDRFNQLSSDLALGHVRGSSRVDWHVVDKDLDDVKQRALLDAALAHHGIPDALNALLPTHPQYGALRAALAVTPATDTARVNLIRLNMDRWRWVPRDLGRKYIIVNIPSFHVTLVQDGVTRWKQRAIAGKVTTKTPNLSVLATGVIMNPWWEVPVSINKEVTGKNGFVAVRGKDGKVQRWRQPPGPSNALGEMKFVMLNKYNIYLHDTNARSRFNGDVRALSHGCVRTQNIVDLATMLLMDDNGPWDPAKVRAALNTRKTQMVNFVKPVPVYIVYFSAAAATDGSITTYSDLYSRDRPVITALLTKQGVSAQAKAADKATVDPKDAKEPVKAD